jgi:SAM-dependent methyltransferase
LLFIIGRGGTAASAGQRAGLLMSTADLQSAEELDSFYVQPDPWAYDDTPDDATRARMALACLPAKDFGRVLDIGCGNGFLTARLPGREVVGIDISEKALHWARQRCSEPRFSFERIGVLELDAARLGQFDLIVMTGVAYPQYIGAAMSLVQIGIDGLLKPGGWLVHAHIAEWFSGGFPYLLVDRHIYPYRDRWHLLESYVK